jgi:hypothetical protein
MLAGNGQVLAFAWAVCGVFAVSLAMGRHRNPLPWLFAGFVFGPAAVALLLLLPQGSFDPAIGLQPESMDLCPGCAEPIRKTAPECRYCGKEAPFADEAR